MPKYLVLASCFFALHVSAQTLVDPTKPSSALGGGKAENPDDLTANAVNKVTAVIVKDVSKYAVLSGAVVEEGDTWQGGKVLKIHRNGVIIETIDGEQELLIHNATIKKDATHEN